MGRIYSNFFLAEPIRRSWGLHFPSLCPKTLDCYSSIATLVYVKAVEEGELETVEVVTVLALKKRVCSGL